MGEAQLRVWAPAADRVDVLCRAEGHAAYRRSMSRGQGGWWHTAVPHEPDAVLDYAFEVDGGPPRPDPRSAWQPEGVHGFSRLVDTASFPWTDERWPGPRQGEGILGGIHYELHIGTFTPEGTLDAAAARLGHLVDLGVDVVSLMPVAAFAGRWGWGYDGVLPYAVHASYGGPFALARFVDAAHAVGLGVGLDVVYNHLGPVGDCLRDFGPYYCDRHATPWGPAFDLEQPEVRRWVLDNAARWFRDFHVDELRLDAVHALPGATGSGLLTHMAQETASLQAALGRPLALVAESDVNDPATVLPIADGGIGMTAQWADDVHHAIHVALTAETQGYYADFADPCALSTTLTGVFYHDGRHSSFRGRSWGRALDRAAVDGRRFVVFLQSHDQVGNRAVGDRIGASLTPGQQAIGAALYLLSAGTPMIFMGEEWAASTPWRFFTDFDQSDPIAEAVSVGRREEFGRHGWATDQVPDPQDPDTRAASVLDWAEATREPHARMLRWYHDLIRIRHGEPDLDDGRLHRVEVAGGVADGWLTVRRGRMVLAVTFRADPVDVPLPTGMAEAEVVLAWSDSSAAVTSGVLALGGHEVALLRARA